MRSLQMSPEQYREHQAKLAQYKALGSVRTVQDGLTVVPSTPTPKKVLKRRRSRYSVLEGQFRRAGFTLEAEYKFDPNRRWRFDYADPVKKVALEIEGGVWTQGRHTRGSGFLKDMEKYNRAATLGWIVFRCTPKMAENGVAVKLLLPFYSFGAIGSDNSARLP